MTEHKTCPKCGAKLPANAPAGICPKCLMSAGLESDSNAQEPAEDSNLAVTTPQPGGFVPPIPVSLAPYFPQLEILDVLGHGGMGAVYKARQTKLDRLVELKTIRPESADDPAFAERFNREARTLARLNHPHIVAVHDFGEVAVTDAGDGRARTLYYFLMEYVDGADLRQLIRAGVVADQAELARLGYVSRARVTQIMNLLNLAPDLQEELLFLPPVERGKDAVTERELRAIVAVVDWGRQRRIMRNEIA